MSFDVIKIDGVNPLSATVFAPDCYFPITDWTRKCMPDDVLMNMPIRMGYWAPNTKAPMITGAHYNIDTTGVAANGCNSPTVRYAMQTCEMIAPQMREVSLQTDPLNVIDLTNDFCRRRNILLGQLQIFDAAGNFAPGRPFAMDFAQWAMDVTYEAWAYLISYSALKGDDANLNQFDGLYTQLSGGWQPSGAACPNGLNTEQVLDWAALTGNTGPVTADTQTTAGHTWSLWGQTINIPAGLNLAQFLERYWFDTVEYNWTAARGGVTQWEAHARYGYIRCLSELTACMKPCNDCGNATLNDPQLRQRFADAVNNKLVRFYPSNRVLPVLETHYMPANTLRIGPRQIGGKPTYMMMWDDISRYFQIFNNADYGGGYGPLPEPTDLVDADSTELSFENRAVRWDFTRVSQKCLQGAVLGMMGELVTARHLWLRIDNIACDTAAFMGQCVAPLSVDGVQLS